MMRFLKLILKTCAWIFCILLLLLAITPTILSQKSVSDRLLQRVNSSINGKISYESFHIGWLSGINIEKLKIQDAQNREVVSIDAIRLQDTLMSTLRSPKNFGNLSIARPNILIIEENKTLSLLEVFSKLATEAKEVPAKEQKVTTHEMRFPITHINISDGSFIFVENTEELVHISNINANLSLDDLKTINAKIHAESLGKYGQGSLDLSSILERVDRNGKENTNIKIAGKTFTIREGKVDFQLKQFPLHVLEAFIDSQKTGQKGVITSALGSNLDLSCSVTRRMIKCRFQEIFKPIISQEKLISLLTLEQYIFFRLR
jgi:hypothetical protein